MSRASSRIKKRKKGKEIVSSINEQQSNCLIIHYSCESFYNITDGRTPRVTSIAVKYFDTGQTKSFSIHKIAETKNVAFNLIADNYDELEKVMLDEFYQFVDSHKRAKWIHLNMRDINYGFEAIAHRYSVLGGIPINIEDSAKIDIGKLLIDIYGNSYIGHPRIETLCRKNNITMINFLTGAEEAEAFNNREYVRLHQSTLRKVDNIHNIITRIHEDDLKTNSNLLKLYGLTPQSLFQIIQENWILSLIVFLLGIIISTLIGKLLS
ncbi:hypothetical protein DYU05_19610 [Mucilaginibacter terrenus]|uniref:Uncharacterized protein n=1 Tax=Mucilaginibacter terrenus TaxID=2482727 RepID=A0A3E2NJN2_9SPHI|nr:hypothetical protein [Mucilaginibacter terrenus]RFZ81195.1 hypothetical protein DYU05_19610 [Mucilaginibacter terrenus]